MASIVEWKNGTMKDIEASANKLGFPLSSYQKECGYIACGVALTAIQQRGISLNNVDMLGLKASIEAIAFAALNPATSPSECYCDIREGYNGKPTTVAIKPQGAGWETLTSRWGRNLDTLSKAFVIREGDEFELPFFDGEKMVGPKFKQTHDSTKKALYVLYIAKLKNGEREYLIADRNSVAKNIIAQVKQNSLYSKELTAAEKDALFARLDGLTVDELIADEELRSKKLINPTYLSPASRESMIETKMKNNALKQFPKDYGNSVIKSAVNTLAYEDEDYGIEKDKTIEKSLSAEESDSKAADFDAPAEETANG